MTSVVLLAAYSAGLISSLTVETLNLPFTTFEEILRVGTHMAGVVNNSAAIALFSVRTQSVTLLAVCFQSIHAGSCSRLYSGAKWSCFDFTAGRKIQDKSILVKFCKKKASTIISSPQ
jgi:hypothetical protein